MQFVVTRGRARLRMCRIYLHVVPFRFLVCSHVLCSSFLFAETYTFRCMRAVCFAYASMFHLRVFSALRFLLRLPFPSHCFSITTSLLVCMPLDSLQPLPPISKPGGDNKTTPGRTCKKPLLTREGPLSTMWNHCKRERTAGPGGRMCTRPSRRRGVSLVPHI